MIKTILNSETKKLMYRESIKRLSYTENTIPMISVYYYESKQTINDTIIIPIYFTDYYQREYYYNDNSLRFKLRYELDGEINYIENLSAGDYSLNLGKLSEGTHWYSLEVECDGISSRRLYNELWIVNPSTYNIKESEIYTVTEADLSTYNINNANSTIENDMINNRVGLSQMFLDKSNEGYRKIIIPKGIYRVNRCIRNGTISNKDCPILIPSGLIVDMNGSTFKMNGYDDRTYGERAKVENVIVKFNNCIDSHLINGTVAGNYDERKNLIWPEDGSNAVVGSNGEHDNSIILSGGSYCSIDNITITQNAGYNLYTLSGGDYGSTLVSAWIENTAIENGIEINKEGYSTSKFIELTESQISSNYIQGAIYLMYGYIKGKHYHMYFNFYDSNKNHIEEIKVYQFTRCRIPNNSKYVRVTLICNADKIGQFNIFHMKVPRYCSINNCNFIDNRTCSAPNQFQFLRYYNCIFENCGQSITPCCIDIEDGWEQSQDLFIDSCENITNNTFLITCACYNLVVENCNNVPMEIRPRTIMTCFKNISGENTVIKYLSQTSETRIEYPIQSLRAYNLNDISAMYISNDETHPIKIKGLNIKGDCTFSNRDNTKVEGLNAYTSKTNLNRPTAKDITGSINYYIGHEYVHVGSVNNEISTIQNVNYGKGSVFQTYNDITEMVFFINSNYMKPIFVESIFKNNCTFKKHNCFVLGYWKDCIFKGNVTIIGNEKVSLGDIEYKGCIFKEIVNLTTNNEFKLLFNDCVFEKGITYSGNASTNCVFNNCTGN